jgi:glutathione synthase/RimK-type ligase-like ATP-grasp enzyme
MLSDESELKAYQSNEPFIIQEFIEPYAVWRTIANQNQVFLSYKKVPENGDWLAAVSLGADRQYHQSSQELIDISCAMSKAVGGGIYGCDIIEDQYGILWAIELNSNCGFEDTDPEIVKKVVDLIEEALFNILSK